MTAPSESNRAEREKSLERAIAGRNAHIAKIEGLLAAMTRVADRNDRSKLIAQARARLLEEIVADVWRWTNDGHPHLELLTAILRRADEEYDVIVELDKAGL